MGKQPKDMLAEVWRDSSVKGLIGFVLGLLLALLVLYPLSVYQLIPNLGRPEDLAAFSTYFGGLVSAIAAVLAVFLVAATVYFTKQMLDVTREEMKKTHEGMKKQNFDDQMFFLLRLFRDVRNEISIKNLSGFAALGSKFHGHIAYVLGNTHENTSADEVKRRCLNGFETELKNTPTLQPYFTTFVSTLSLMEEVAESAGVEDYKSYLDMMTAFLTQDEVIVLSMYSWSGLCNDGMDRVRLAHYLENYAERTLQGIAVEALTHLRPRMLGSR